MRLAVVGFGLWAVACAASSAQNSANARSSKPKAVSIAKFAFGPAELAVSRGDTVTWINDDPLPHSTSADSGAWSSPELAPGQHYAFIARVAGRFSYHCAAHPVMRAVLVVLE